MNENVQPAPERAAVNDESRQDAVAETNTAASAEREGERGGNRPTGGRHGRSRGGRGGRRPFESRTDESGGQSSHSRTAESSVNLDELREIIELIDKHGFNEFELERRDFRVALRRHTAAPAAPNISHTTIAPAALSQSAPAAATTTASPSTAPAPPLAAPQPEKNADEDLHIITSPIVGTFYRAASPTAEPFVKIGSRVENESVVCIIEAMKLMNEIQAEASGEIAKIYVENAQPVEFGQPLFGLKR